MARISPEQRLRIIQLKAETPKLTALAIGLRVRAGKASVRRILKEAMKEAPKSKEEWP